MIISKPQQFVIYDCDAPVLQLSSLDLTVRNNIEKIVRITSTGIALESWYGPDGGISSSFSTLEPNKIYLIYSKNLNYDLMGVVNPLIYCQSSSNIISTEYPSSFFKINITNEEFVVEFSNIILPELGGLYLKAKAKEGYKNYNHPWGFYLDELEISSDLDSALYNLKPSSIQQALLDGETNHISVIFDLSLIKNIEIRGSNLCKSPLYWNFSREYDSQKKEYYLMGFCDGDCPPGYEKVHFDTLSVCYPIEFEIDSDSEYYRDSEFLDTDLGSDLFIDSDLFDYGSDTDVDILFGYPESLLKNMILPDLPKFNWDLGWEYNFKLIQSVLPEDVNQIQIIPISTLDLINNKLGRSDLDSDERDFWQEQLEGINNV